MRLFISSLSSSTSITPSLDSTDIFMTNPEPRSFISEGNGFNIIAASIKADRVSFSYQDLTGSWNIIGDGTKSGTTFTYPSFIPSEPLLLVRATAHGDGLSDNDASNSIHATVLNDTFTASDGTLLVNHTADSDWLNNGWNVISGNWEINSNRIGISSASGSKHFAIYDAQSDSVQIRCTPTVASGTIDVVLRYQDENNHYLVSIQSDRTVLLGVVQGGVYTELDRQATWVTSGGEIMIQLSGNAITVTFNQYPYVWGETTLFEESTSYGIGRGTEVTTSSFSSFNINTIPKQPIDTSVIYSQTKSYVYAIQKGGYLPYDANSCSGQDIFYIGDTKYMTFAMRDASSDFGWLSYAYETSPHVWQRVNSLIITATPSRSISSSSSYWDGTNLHVLWCDRFTGVIMYYRGTDLENLIDQGVLIDLRSQGVYSRHPEILVYDGVWYVYLDTRSDQPAGEFGNIAVMSGPDLNNLSNYREVLSNPGYEFEQCDVGSPDVRYNQTNGYFEMCYAGYPGGGAPYIHEVGVAICKTPDGKFQRISETPLIPLGTPPSFDDYHVHGPCWYEGGDAIYYGLNSDEDGISYTILN